MKSLQDATKIKALSEENEAPKKRIKKLKDEMKN